VNLTDAEPRPFEPIAEVGTVLAHEVARRGDEANVPAATERLGDRDPEHHFGLARTRGSLEQEFELAGRELLRDLVDRASLIVRERKALPGLNEVVRERDRVFVFLDAFPNRAGRFV
jgi:hypothetical protein